MIVKTVRAFNYWGGYFLIIERSPSFDMDEVSIFLWLNIAALNPIHSLNHCMLWLSYPMHMSLKHAITACMKHTIIVCVKHRIIAYIVLV